jgi:hypothetical protein
MKQRFGSVIPLCLLFAGLSFTGVPTVAAQNQPGSASPPPKILEIITENLKPGQGGSPHMKTESAFVQAMRSANWPTHYIGTDAITGDQRAVFFVAYDSFADWQKDYMATMKNTTLASALDSAGIADGALLSSIQTSAFAYRPDLSLRPDLDISQMRLFDITIFHLRVGHENDWEALNKMYVAALQNNPNAHWATFEKLYGNKSGDTFIIISALKSMTEVDQELADGIKLDSTLSEDQKRKMRDLSSSSTESYESHLFAFNPKMSYVSDAWIQASPDFWGQK